MGLIIASAFALVPGILCCCGSFPVSAKNAFCSALIAVSTLTCALSFFVSETYPLLQMTCLEIPAPRNGAEAVKSPAGGAGRFRQRREVCRSEVEAIFDIFVTAE